MKNPTKILSRGNEPKIQENLVFVPDYKDEPWLFLDLSNKKGCYGDVKYKYHDKVFQAFEKLSKTDPLGKMPEMDGILYSKDYIVIDNNYEFKISFLPSEKIGDIIFNYQHIIWEKSLFYNNTTISFCDKILNTINDNTKWTFEFKNYIEKTLAKLQEILGNDFYIKYSKHNRQKQWLSPYNTLNINNSWSITVTYQTLGEDKYVKLLELINLK